MDRLQAGGVDLLILDLEMPEMDGLQTLKELAARGIRTKTLVFSSKSKRGAEITFEALRLGADDFVAKPGPGDNDTSPQQKIRQLIETVMELTQEKQIESSAPVMQNPEVIVIAASTGGPGALEKMFSKVKGPLTCPVLIVQHMPPVFTTTFAERLQKVSGIECREGVDGEKVTNRIYVAPGDFHMQLAGTRDAAFIEINQNEQVQMVRPAADPLFMSAARIFGKRALAFVLTGMGADGADGAGLIKNTGGTVVIQNPASCVVFGMPGAVKNRGFYDYQMNPEEMAAAINLINQSSFKTLHSA